MATQRQDEVMGKAKQAKSQAKEKNHNLKEIEDLRQRRETYDIQKKKVMLMYCFGQKCYYGYVTSPTTTIDIRKTFLSIVERRMHSCGQRIRRSSCGRFFIETKSKGNQK